MELLKDVMNETEISWTDKVFINKLFLEQYFQPVFMYQFEYLLKTIWIQKYLKVALNIYHMPGRPIPHQGTIQNDIMPIKINAAILSQKGFS